MMNKKIITTIALVLMTLFSFSGFLTLSGNDSVNLASITLLVGIVAFFLTREKREKDSFSLKGVPGYLKNWKLDVLILMPVIMNLICYLLAKAVLPQFLEHLMDRIGFLSFGSILILLAELGIAALGEEIAWRGFYLTKLADYIPFPAALVLSAALFSICHFASGSLSVVLYDLLFIFINALLYGLIYRKTGNILISTLSHFLANLFGIFGLFLIL